MDGEEIGMVLARASELRSKVSSCVQDRARQREGGGADSGGVDREGEEVRIGEGEEEESLLQIRDALASLEQQLASLQDLQQQQLYERESTLAQIDRSRMILLSKLKEYRGEDLEVIYEAGAFAGETIERGDDLLLPPYPRHLSDSLVLDDLYSSNYISKHKISRNGFSREPKNLSDDSGKQVGSVTRNRWTTLRLVAGFVAKSAVSIISVMSILSLAGVEPKLGRHGVQLKLSDLFQKSAGDDKLATIRCPPGKVFVLENGEARCVVKERVEIPFESDVKDPNLSYGFG